MLLLGAHGARLDGPDAIDRILELRVQGGEHGRHLVAGRGVLAAADRHGAGRHERGLGHVLVGQHVGPQRAGAEPEDDVVDGAVEGVLEGLHVVERDPGEADGPQRRQAAVPGRAGGGERGGAGLAGLPAAPALGDPVDRGHRVAEELGQGDELADPAGGGVAEQLEVVGDVLGLVLRGRGRLGGLGLQVEQVDHQLGARAAVDGGVVDLGDDADAVLLEALDDPQLPQGTGAVQRGAGDLPGHLAQLAAAAGGGAADAADVEVQVEVRVLDPERVRQVERHLAEPAGERRHQVEPASDELLEVLERVAAGDGAGVQHHRHGHVHVVGGVLQVQEGRIEPGQTFHSHSHMSVRSAFCQQPGDLDIDRRHVGLGEYRDLRVLLKLV